MNVLEAMRAIAFVFNGPVGCYKQLAGLFFTRRSIYLARYTVNRNILDTYTISEVYI